MTMKPGVVGDAFFPPGDRCRMWLSRTWDKPKGYVLFTGLNPSKAGADVDDMTVTKGMGFARLWGFGGTVHVNAYPYIATNPADLKHCTEDEIEKNDATVLEMAAGASLVVLAWGSFPKFKQRFWKVSRMLADFNPVCVGRTKDGFPQHISRIGYETPRELWRAAAVAE